MDESSKGYNLRRGKAAQKSGDESSDDDGVAELLSSTGRPKRSSAANGFSSIDQPASKRRKVNSPENAAASSGRPAGFGDSSTGRFCVSCGTTATSQWRRGPNGMLCNSCGLKAANQQRSRRQNKSSYIRHGAFSFFGFFCFAQVSHSTANTALSHVPLYQIEFIPFQLALSQCFCSNILFCFSIFSLPDSVRQRRGAFLEERTASENFLLLFVRALYCSQDGLFL